MPRKRTSKQQEDQEEGDDEKKDSGARQLPEWTCKCGTLNTLQPENPADCDWCKKLSSGTLCYYHSEVAKGEHPERYNDICINRWKHFKYSDPDYDALGVMIREARRALSLCSKTKDYNQDFEDPREMRKDLRDIEKKVAAGKMNNEDALERADEILWNACMHLDFRYAGDSIGLMLNHIDMIIPDLDAYISSEAEMQELRKKRGKRIEKDSNTFEVKSSDKKTTYLVNLEDRYCSCPGFTNYNDCKHVNMPKPKNAKMPKQQEPKAKKQRK